MNKLSFIDELNNTDFESSSGLTPQFASFRRLFKKEFKNYLENELGATNLDVHKGHFYLSGFFTAPNGQIYYFSSPDVRFNKGHNNILVRTAKSYSDYTGGPNKMISTESTDKFKNELKEFISREREQG